MTDEAQHPARLERSRRPTAIVHEGFFVYANAVFLDRLGYKSLDELLSVPLLDLVDEKDHEALRKLLDAAKKCAGTDTSHPEARLSYLRSDGLPLLAGCTAFHTRHAGEDCVQLTLVTREDTGFSGALKALPWRQYLSILFLFLFTVLPSTLLLKLNIDNSPTVYFPEDEPAVILDRELHSRFPNDQVLVLLFEGVALFSDGFLEAYNGLSERLQQQEAVDDVISITTQDHIAGTQDEFIVERLVDTRKLQDSRPEQRRQRIMTDRFAKDALIGPEGGALAMVVIPRDSGNSLERLALEEAILTAVDQSRLRGYLVAVAGQIPVDVAQLRSMLRDNMIFIPATVAIGLGLIWWLFRRWLAVMLAGIAIGVVVNSTVAFYVLFDQPFTLISSIIPPLLSALTVAALVHLFNAIYLASRRGFSGPERVARAIEKVDRPAWFVALTTAGGLASLATSPIVPIKVFGLISAAGSVLIYLVVFRILPNLVARWDKRSWTGATGGARMVDGIVSMLYRLGMRHPLSVVVTISIVIAAGIPQVGKVVVETNLQEFFDYTHQVRRDTRYVGENLVGTMPLAIIFDTDGRNGLKDAAALKSISEFQKWLGSQPEVDRSLGLADFVEEMHWAFNAENPVFRTLPGDSQLISQYLLIYDGEDIYDFVDRDFQHSFVALNLNVHSANEISKVLERIRNYLSQNIRGDLQWEIAGLGRLFADMEDLLVTGQVFSLWGAVVLIFFFMLFVLRSFGAAILCMIPNLSPIFLIFVAMGTLGIWLDMATAMAASVAIGIAVDDTIHIFHGFQERMNRGLSPTLALARTYRGAGRAVVVTTIILSAQFLILVWSDFVPTRNFGLLTAVGLVTALLFDLLLLPALLIIIYGKDNPVAGWLGRWSTRKPQEIGADEFVVADSGLDKAYWTSERKVALVREILAGKTDMAGAAHEYRLPETEVAKWLATAETGINDAFSDASVSGLDTEKVRALANAYKKLTAENRQLKAGQKE